MKEDLATYPGEILKVASLKGRLDCKTKCNERENRSVVDYHVSCASMKAKQYTIISTYLQISNNMFLVFFSLAL